MRYLKFFLSFFITFIIILLLMFLVFLLIVKFSIHGVEQLLFELSQMKYLNKALLYIFTLGIISSNTIDISKFVDKKIDKFLENRG